MEQTPHEAGLQSFLKKVCLATAGGLLLTGATAAAVINFAPNVVSEKALLVGGAVVGVGSMIAICFTKTNYKLKDHVVVADYSVPQRLLYPTFFISEGIMLAPLLRYADLVSPAVIPISLCITGATVAGMVTFALSRPKGSLLRWGAPLQIGMWGLLGTSVVAAITRSSMVEMIGCLAGVVLFAGATAHDVHKAIESYDIGQPDHMLHATTFYLDFLNMFIRVLEIYLKVEEEKEKRKRVYTSL
eukprot:Phypoly_transcript_17409.p1 GENE.Phypoly_transcript_17409~~Phypoly_transcript_17409.p1  ORF type:complete len:244 (+),score=32.73 Phypoly_transcript_17409:51-782(+)